MFRNNRNKIVLFVLFVIISSLLSGSINVSAYKKPQIFSSDTAVTPEEFEQEVAEIVLPEIEVKNGISVWFNKSKVISDTPAVYRNGTVYFPLRSFFDSLGMTVEVLGLKISLKGSNVEAHFTRGKKDGTVNGTKIQLTHPPMIINETLMAPANMAAEVLNAKVWYDEDGQTLAITTGAMKSDEVLRIIDGKLYMNGEPYYEYSFNKWDLANQIYSEYHKHNEWPSKRNQFSAAEEALSILHENGFKSIRVFMAGRNRNPSTRTEDQKTEYYEFIDRMLDLCDKYDIKIVACLFLPDGVFCAEGEDGFDLICDPNSESRKNMNDYLVEFVEHVKDRKTILMYEVVNEGNLSSDLGYYFRSAAYSIRQLGNFYADIAATIKTVDPDRPVTGGDSELRSHTWHTYRAVRSGYYTTDWTQDTLEERLLAYWTLYHGIDVISVHAYNAGDTGIAYAKSYDDPETVPQDLNLYMSEAARLGKPLYDGETGLAVVYQEYNDETFPMDELVEYLNETIDAGVQLTHWWTFHCDRIGHEAEDTYGWKMSFGKGLEAIRDANIRLKERYCVNKIPDDNTNEAWKDKEDTFCPVEGYFTVAEGRDLKEDAMASFGEVAAIAGTVAAVAAVIWVLIVLQNRKKEKDN